MPEYFGTGYGTKSDINLINELYCISNKNVITGGVYDSIYYGYQTLDSEWTYESGTVFFRHPDAYVLDMQLDDMNSEYVSYIDPKSDELLRVSNKFYNWYYNSLTSMSAYIGNDGKLKEDADHDHQFEYESDWEHHWNSCDCGYKDIPKLHSFGVWEITNQNTCTSSGEQQRKCKICDYVEITSIPASHNYSEGIGSICGERKPSEGLSFVQQSNGTYHVSKGSCTDANVIIPSEYNGKPVTKISDWAFMNSKNIESIYIPNTITEIGYNAFSGCKNLSDVSIDGQNLENIGRFAFSNCVSLSKISIPEGVTTVDDYAFGNCDSLTSITIPSSVMIMGKWAFHGCDWLSNIYCKSAQRPYGWDDSWDYDCDATVLWGN